MPSGLGHVVDGLGELGDLALRLDDELRFERSPFATAVTTFAMPRTCVVRFDGHAVDVVGEVLPRAGDAGHERLTTELAFGTDLARDARDLGGEARGADRPSC